jgi:hypothetical protein
VGGCGKDASGSGKGSLAGPSEHDIETSDFIKDSEFLD